MFPQRLHQPLHSAAAPSIISTCVLRHIKTVLTTSPVILLEPLKTFPASHCIRSAGETRRHTLKNIPFFKHFAFCGMKQGFESRGVFKEDFHRGETNPSFWIGLFWDLHDDKSRASRFHHSLLTQRTQMLSWPVGDRCPGGRKPLCPPLSIQFKSLSKQD